MTRPKNLNYRRKAVMAGYMVGNITVTDPETFAKYGKLVPETVAHFGGAYVVRGGTPEKIEGNYDPVRIVILQFESVEKAREWYDSPEYAPLKEMRLKSSTGDLYFVDGV
jgi:uncharacterized protein (DUF1330 family)